ncbi:MAG: xanthine dehydrogenase family protein molybdopterin-binding subunit, partial [Alphaproteobacteria bacterium]|nr:xanthine dehydrogenase family protein molybdopterin-binding subunit [Alphaproteobacteria bacterium]
MMSARRSFIENVSRRNAIRMLSGGLVLAVSLPRTALAAAAPEFGADAEPGGWRDNPKLFVRIAPDGHVTFICPRQEMGQGIRTSLALSLADEMEADLARVSAVQADGDQARWGNQNTDGSRSLRHFFMPMRRAGAAARLMLEQAAAAHWGVPTSEVRASDHTLIHEKSGQRLDFGAVAAAASALPVPTDNTLRLKDPSQFRYIGKDKVTGVDLDDITTGRAQYGIDIRLPGQLYGVVARPPVLGGKLAHYDATAALKVPGVVKVVVLEQPKPGYPLQATGGIAVIARNSWAAIQGRKALKLDWVDGANSVYSSDRYRAELQAAVRKPGKLVHNEGDIETALK